MSGDPSSWKAYAGYCDACCKKSYWTRRQAKAACRALDKSMSAYPCGTLWHIGHLPASIISGNESREQLRARKQYWQDRSAS